MIRLLARNRIVVFCSFVGVLLGATSFDFQKVQTSIDASYIFVYQNLFTGDFASKTIALTYGPLGFLVHALDIGYIKALLILLNSLIGLAAGYLVYLYINKLKNGWFKYLSALLSLYIVSIQVFEWKIYAVFLLAAIWVYLQKKEQLLIWLAAISTLALFVKLSLGITCVVSVVLVATLLKVSRSCWTKILVCFVGSYILFGLILFRSTTKLASYTTNGFFVSSGYTDAMGIQPANWKVTVIGLVAGATIILISSLLTLPKKDRKLTLLFMAPVFFVWKASIVRQDAFGHVEALPFFLMLIFVVSNLVLFYSKKVLLNSNQLIKVTGVFAGVIIMLFAVHLNGLTLKRFVRILEDPMTFWVVEDCRLSPCKDKNLLSLGDVIKRKVGSETVDIYPWENLFVKVNSLNWQPRPSPASYGTYLPKLDNLNAAHWTTKDAPAYIIWDLRESVLSIDGRHIFFDEPKSLLTMLLNYSYVTKDGSYVVLKKSSTNQPAAGEFENYKKLEWEKWINVSDETGSRFVRVSIRYTPNVKQSVGSLVFRNEPIEVELKKKSGATRKFRVVSKNLEQGIIVDQLPFDNDELVTVLRGNKIEDPVVSFKFIGKNKGSLFISDERL